jgi:hypothetical protein
VTSVVELGKFLVAFGVVMVLVGVVLLLSGTLSDKVPWLGRLPGDIHIKRDGWSVYVPLGTSILLSILLTLVLAFFNRR